MLYRKKFPKANSEVRDMISEPSEPRWVDVDALRALHRRHLAEHGGADGVRDEGLFESALMRPQQRWHYEPDSSLAVLASSYCYGLARNHPFVDGNKRTATIAMLLFLALNGQRVEATEDELYDQVIGIASSQSGEEELTDWLSSRLRSR
jgi:death-on-curing protein